MATETFLDFPYERAKSTKRPLRPKLLKLTDVATPHRSRKKTKVKSKDRSTTVRDRIYDDPAYTEDISHLANPLRRSSISGKSSGDYKLSSEPVASSSSLGKRSQLTKDFLKYAVNKPLKANNSNNSNSNSKSNSGAVSLDYDFDYSSSDNEPPEPINDGGITRRVLSLERSLAAASEKNEKKTSTLKRSSKQKRNLSLDNSRKGAQSKPSYESSEPRNRKERNNRKQYLETENPLGEQQDDIYSVRSSTQNSAATMPVEASTKLPIGRRFLRGEIGIKSFNYYLLKEGLKSTKKLDKQRSAGDATGSNNSNSNSNSNSHSNNSNMKKLHTRSEENIYEEIFFKELPTKQDNSLAAAVAAAAVAATTTVAVVQSDDEIQSHQQQQQQCLPDASVYADCELCMQQCSNENCKYCLVQDETATVVQQQQQHQQQQQQQQNNEQQAASATASGLPAAHILEFQSYNPNNPGVYKIETTPVAITGEYNPILQFQQSSATTSTSATTTPSEQQQPHQHQHQQQLHHHHQQQQHQQQQQQLYGSFYQQQGHHKAYQQHNVASHPLTNHYAVGGSLLLAQVTPRRPQQQQTQQQQQQQGYIVSYQNGGGGGSGGAAVHRMNTKSSSSSDSLPYHKYNTMARLEANALYAAPGTGDIYYAIGGMGGQPLHPLMYAASRPIGGSQILVDQYEPPQMYKSDSRASILSEFSLRSSDNSQRFSHRYPHRSSLFSSHSNAHQRRYFGSTESCRIPYDCRRCSLDGVMGGGGGGGVGVAGGVGGSTPADKCSYSDNCRYECRNCDCSSSYFSSDFDDIYGSMARGGSSGIPRKTAAGTLPSSGPAEPAEYEQVAAPMLPPQQPPQMDLKQNKYAMDFFKHVNDVKRSIYQSEMQRNNSLESTRRIHRNSSSNNPKASPKRAVSQPQETTLVVTTLPLSKGRSSSATKPTPAPRTSLQNQGQQQPTTSEEATPTPSKRKPQPTERREYPSLDRLVASTTGAIPKRQSRAIAAAAAADEEPKSSKSKAKHKETEPRERRDRSAPAAAGEATSGVTLSISSKRHHRSNSGKSHPGSGNPVPNIRRKDIPAPPPPSPATYSDLQELKANMEGLQDDTKSRSLESETCETPTTTELKAAQTQAKAALVAQSALTAKLATSPAVPAAPPEISVKCSAATMASKSATEAEDDDVFYDARSEDSAGGLSVVSTGAEGAEAVADISQPGQTKDECVAQPKRELSGILTQAAVATLAKDSIEQQQQQQQPQQQLPKAIVESAMPNDAASLLAANVSARGSQEPTNDEQVDKVKSEATTATAAAAISLASATAVLATLDSATTASATTALSTVAVSATIVADNMKSCETCCASDAGECVQHGEATVKTNGELASKTKRKNVTGSGNVDATCAEGQTTSLLPTNVEHSNSSNMSNNKNINDGNSNVNDNDIDSTTIGATLELEFSCKSENTDSATLANSEPATTVLTRPDYTCLDSSEAQSDDSHLTRDSVTRESQNDELSSSTLDKIDLSTLPLPALPPKRRRTRSRASPSKHHQQQQQQQSEHADGADKSIAASAQQYRKPKRDSVQDSVKAELLSDNINQHQQQQQQQQQQAQHHQQQPHLSAFQQYVAKRRESLEASTRNFNEKLEARRMLYHMGGNGGASGAPAATDGGVPTYLFGEHFYGVPTAMRKSTSPAGNKEEIFLNKSGWVQVSTKLNSSNENKSRRLNYAHQNGDASAMLDKPHGGRSAIRVIQMDQMRRPDIGRQSFVHQPASMCEREPKFVGSKVEELIQRNEARLSGMSSRDPALRPGYRILDPQLASILNERPGFLPVKSPNDLESPPPITPILSPPPAFQDNSNSSRPPRHPERRKVTRQSHTLVQQPRALQPPPQLNAQHHQQQQLQQHINPKGMVFSRSFEYDTRRPAPTNSYVETFSRSFDGNLSERPTPMPTLAVQRERSLNFSTLTGNSPNYLTKREGGGGGGGAGPGTGGGSSRSLRSRDNSPKYLQPQTTAYLNASVKEAPPAYSVASNNLAKYSPRSRHDRTFERSKSHNVIGRSRKSQFSRMGNSGPAAPPPVALGMSRFRSLDTTINNRLNSCDSGARSDLSNDELDNEDGSSTEFLSATNYQFPNVSGGSISISPFKTQRQRSLTPDRNDSHSSSSSLRKQRSLTPESRSLTPEERRKKGSQVSLMSSRQNSSSRSNTLERRQRHEDKTPPTISRSSSSSSYSGGDSHEPLNGSPSTVGAAAGGASGVGNYRRVVGRSTAKQQAEQEHLIRRSRSLQLSERSPNRGHKSVVCVGGASPQQQQQQLQPTVHYQQSSAAIFPSSMRANKILPSSNGASGNPSRLRQADVDKACSFDFDYNNYNRGAGNNASNAPRSVHNSGSGGDSGSNQNLRLDFDKSRSFDEDYREALLNNNGGGSSSSSIRFLQPGNETGAVVSTSSGRLRQSNSPVGATGHERNTTRSPQSSGSSSNNLHLPSRRTSSPQSYGTRLCDHELTYDMMRKSPIMNFRRGDSDYELPMQLRNRETINSGGNSELNFMSNETRIYEHPTTVMKPQRSSSREDHLYRQTAAPPRGSSPGPEKARTTSTNKKCRKSLNSCDYWPRCDACSNSSALQHSASSPAVQQSLFSINRQNSMPTVMQEAQQPHVSTVAVNVNVIKLDMCETAAVPLPLPLPPTPAPATSKYATPQWTLLCSGGVHAAADSVPQKPPQLTKVAKDRRQPTAVIRPRVIPLTASSLVLLGDCDLVPKAAERTDISPSTKNNLKIPNASELTNQQCQQPAANGNKRDLVAILTEANSNGVNRKRQRSHSLPERSPTTTTASEQLLTTRTVMG